MTKAKAKKEKAEKKPKADAPAKPGDHKSPKALAKYDTETRKITMAALVLVEAKESQWVAAKDVAKEAKEDMEVAERELRQLIKDREAQRGKAPQPKPAKLYPDPTDGHPAAQADTREPGEVPPPEDDAWKAVPLTDLILHDGLLGTIVDKLADADHKERGKMAPITTVGELAAYTTPEPNGWTKKLTDLKGIGPAKVELIDKALESFWARWRARDAAKPGGGGEGAGAGASDGPGEAAAGTAGDMADAGQSPADADAVPEPVYEDPEAAHRKKRRQRKAKA